MRRFRWVRGIVLFGLAGALVGVVPDGVSAVLARQKCRPAAFVANGVSGTLSTIDVETRTKNPTDISVGSNPSALAVTPNGKTVFVGYEVSGTVSAIDVKTRLKNSPDIAVAPNAFAVAVTPNGKTAFVTNDISNTVSTIHVKTRAKKHADIRVGAHPNG